jgi:hypothetical protein
VRRDAFLRWRTAVAASAAAAAVLCAGAAIAETARSRPANPDATVLVLPAPLARAGLERRAEDAYEAAVRAETFAALARKTRDARYFGRAQALVEPWLARTDAPSRLLVAAADLAQQRHEFSEAHRLLDRAVAAQPTNLSARLSRANLALLTGRFAAARDDCRAVLAAGATLPGTICHAAAMTGPGSLGRARRLLAAIDDGRVPAPLASWLLLTQADLALRDDDSSAAVRLLQRARALDPAHEETRARLAGALLERGEPVRALALTRGEDAALVLLVARLRAATSIDDGVAATARRDVDAWLDIGRRRASTAHLREEGELALHVDGDAGRALALARRNFGLQKDTPDLRLLIDAAIAADDRAMLAYLRRWLEATGFEDRVAAARLAAAGA